MNQALVLTEDQGAAETAIVSFLMNPKATVMVVSGYAGTGKSTLVKKVAEDLPTTLKAAKLITMNDDDWEVQFTATTNKAAEALQAIIGTEVRTIQSFLGLMVMKDHKTGVTSLMPRGDVEIQKNVILFVDEASYADRELLQWLFTRTQDCKIILIGDPAQLSPIKSPDTPAFTAGFSEAKLTKIVRQAEGNPIIALATSFRNCVNGAPFFSFKPDGHHIQHKPRGEFERMIVAEFGRPDWKHNDSKVLAWTNKTVIGYNKGISQHISGTTEFQVGDYAVCNSYINTKACSIKTDQTVRITNIEPAMEYHTPGWNIQLDGSDRAFMPANLDDKKNVIKWAKSAEKFGIVKHVETHWIDLRAEFASTINKSQGSTYNTVFIDLDDIKKCNSGNQIARMMYVAVSRARNQVILTGDLV